MGKTIYNTPTKQSKAEPHKPVPGFKFKKQTPEKGK